MTASALEERWQGRRVLVTGHTGFKGSWLCALLTDAGATVHGVSLPEPPSTPSLWDELVSRWARPAPTSPTPGWTEDARRFDPEHVFHLAAQPLVSEGYRDPLTTHRSNVEGTARVMALLESLPVRSTVIITTDKVYDVRQQPPYAEGGYLGGADPYSASKAAAELRGALLAPRRLPGGDGPRRQRHRRRRLGARPDRPRPGARLGRRPGGRAPPAGGGAALAARGRAAGRLPRLRRAASPPTPTPPARSTSGPPRPRPSR